MFELVGQSSDYRIKVRGGTLEELFADSVYSIMALLVADPASVGAGEKRFISVRGSRLDDLLQDFLSEVLALSFNRWLVRRADVVVTDLAGRSGAGWNIEAQLSGERWDMARHPPQREVKAITYQGLRVEPVASAWDAEFVVDL